MEETKQNDNRLGHHQQDPYMLEQKHELTAEVMDTTPMWNIIHTQFRDNPHYLVQHHLDSYNHFYAHEISQIFRNNNPIRFMERQIVSDDNVTYTAKELQSINEMRARCSIYLGGKDGTRIYYGKPVLYRENEGEVGQGEKDYIQYMYPNDARLRSMTYGFTIHYDVEVETTYYDTENDHQEVKQTHLFERVFLGHFPIMVQSNMCILAGMTREARFNCGEGRNDLGGYFIIHGKEKVIVSQEKMADNMVIVQRMTPSDLNPFSLTCDIHSVSEDTSKPVRYMSVKMYAKEGHIVAFVPMAAKPIPLFILMRALGIVSDKSIIEYCLLDLDKNRQMIDLFIPSIHDAGVIFSQDEALTYISQLFMKRGTITETFNVLMNYFLPHIGENNFLEKAYFLGHMVYKMLRVHQQLDPPTDRDSFKYKRIETTGALLRDLFREYWIIQNQAFFVKLDKELYYKRSLYGQKDALILQSGINKLVENIPTLLRQTRLVERGFHRAFRGNWGAGKFTKRVGVVQDLNRLSWFTFMSHLRKTVLHLDLSAKIVAPHLLQSSQWGMLDPLDTPDGGEVGLHKHMTLSVVITNSISGNHIMEFIKAALPIRPIQQFSPLFLSAHTKIFVNGVWFGILMSDDAIETVRKLRWWRRNGLLPVHLSISFEHGENAIYIYGDGGRLTRPYLYRKLDGEISYWRIRNRLVNNSSRPVSWRELLNGFNSVLDRVNYDRCLNEGMVTAPNSELVKHEGALEFLDVIEEENALIANNMRNFMNATADTSALAYTHMEIDPSLILGVMGNSIIFPEHNQLPRDVFSCSQSRQSCSIYNSNYPVRMDKSGIILNYGQIPLIKSKYLKYINHEEVPYGVNTIVAIMSYTGYNVEDAILINRASLDRGLFLTSYMTTYENSEIDYEDGGDEDSGGTAAAADEGLEMGKMMFANPLNMPNITGLKSEANYEHLNSRGMVAEGTPITDKTVIIGKVIQSKDGKTYTDGSKVVKKGQKGVVDRVYVTAGEPGSRIAKIRICDLRVPAIGDKMASRAGQKGTIGLVIPEAEMPFDANGVRPDIIINPHALPSRMTIGHLIESLFGKACVEYGAYGDCTAFGSKGINYAQYGRMLQGAGLHPTGNNVLYSGFTGEQIEADIYVGPTYYMRLKHMVQDKINHRGTGKRDVLTRQTNHGRADDGGLRVGEMERDAILAHGAAAFLTESFMERGDEYYLAVCNKSGCIALYNEAQDIYFSPFVDGPVSFNETIGPTGDVIQNLKVKSKFGRSFSLVRIPYSFKLLLQELQAMNIQMRIITDSNVDQMLSLGFQSEQSAENRRIMERLQRQGVLRKAAATRRGGADDDSDDDTASEEEKSEEKMSELEDDDAQEQAKNPYRPYTLYYSTPLQLYYGLFDHNSDKVIDFTKLATEIALRKYLLDNQLNRYRQQLTPDKSEVVWVDTETNQIEPAQSPNLRHYDLSEFNKWFPLSLSLNEKLYENQVEVIDRLMNQKLDAAKEVSDTVLPDLATYVHQSLDVDKTMHLGNYFPEKFNRRLNTYQYADLDTLLTILSRNEDGNETQHTLSVMGTGTGTESAIISPAFSDTVLLEAYHSFPAEIQTQILSVPAKDQEVFVRRLMERNEEKKREKLNKDLNNPLLRLDEDDVDDNGQETNNNGLSEQTTRVISL